MSYIVLDEAQARIVAQAKGAVEIRDRAGKHLGYLAHGFTDDDIRLARERAASSAPRLTTSEVLDHLSNSRMMPKYTVLWHTEATNDLAELWIEAIDRHLLTNSAAAIDREMNNNPISKGHELSEGLRVFVEPPLQVLFVVHEDDRIVEVLRLKLI